MRRIGALVLAGSLLTTIATTTARADTPHPELNFATTLLPEQCVPEQGNTHEIEWADREGWPGTSPDFEYYPGACQRLRFRYGPVLVKPGQNNVLIEPVKIEQPRYDGFMTRFDPDLVYVDGTVPGIEKVHLHHAVWTTSNAYGHSGHDAEFPSPDLRPFVASGEEKTILRLPPGYGMPVKATDDWELLYMIHSAVPQPTEVYITYDVDFVAADDAEALGIKPVYPLWLDVLPQAYPVFNTQKGFGTDGTCTWPKEQCATLDPFGGVSPGQGAPPDRPGTDLQLPLAGEPLGRHDDFQGGTLITLGGHLHPGGLRNEIDLVRNGVAKRIYTGEAHYWDRTDPTQTGGPPTSWDFSEAVVGLPTWGVRVEPGDVLRSNATYDTELASVYEGMGIAVGFVSPDDASGAPTAPGVDPFDPAVAIDSAACPSATIDSPTPTLCTRGYPTHGHLPENDNFGGPSGATELTAGPGQVTDRVDIAAFVYAPGDLSMIQMTGIPQVRQGQALRFTNMDAAIDVYHTVTTCAYPCLGPVGTAFPLADGMTSMGTPLDRDSTELGFDLLGLGAVDPIYEARQDDLMWDFDTDGLQPGEIVTYFCRIHPLMRGAFEVTAS